MEEKDITPIPQTHHSNPNTIENSKPLSLKPTIALMIIHLTNHTRLLNSLRALTTTLVPINPRTLFRLPLAIPDPP